MFTFNNFKRVIALLFALLIAISAEAQHQVVNQLSVSSNVFTVNTTVSTTTGSTGNTGSFMDAVEKINKEGGAWKIVFECSGTIEVNESVKFTEKCEELEIVGNDDLVVDLKGYSCRFYGIVSLHNTNFKSESKQAYFYFNDSVAYIRNSTFSDIRLSIRKCSNIYNCEFKDNGGLEGKTSNTEEIKTVFDIDTIDNCRFNNIRVPLYMASFGLLRNCELVDCNYTFNFCTAKKMDSCKILNSYVAFQGSSCDSIVNCSIESTDTWIAFNDNGANHKKNFINVIKGCKFYGDVNSISSIRGSTSRIGEISECRFAPTETRAIGCFEDIVMYKDTFEINDGESLCISSCCSGTFSQNIFLPKESAKINPIGSEEAAPAISSVSFYAGKYVIKGTASNQADIELFLSDGSQASAVQYLTIVNTVKKDGKYVFEAEIPAKDLKYPYSSFVATATYENKRTSGLSKPAGVEFPKNIYVKKTGKGDGSSWEKAMSEEMFAAVLPIVKDGTTFHVAEGRYSPLYDENKNLAKKGVLYSINSDVTIIGGYSPEEVDETVSNDPINYHTVFTTDPSGDNVYDETISDPSKDDIGNTKGIFLMSGAKNISFDGVEFTGCNSLEGDSKVNLNLSKCTFRLTRRAVELVYNLTIDNCLFTQMTIGSSPSTIIAGVDGIFEMRNSTVTDITGTSGYILSADYETHHPKKFILINNTFTGTKFNKYAGYNGLIYLPDSPCEIYNNTIINCPIGSGAVFNNYPSSLSFAGNLIVANDGVSSIDDVIDIEDATVYGYNMYDFEGTSKDLKSTLPELIGDFVDGKYESGIFVANLDRHDNYTPTIALTATADSRGNDVRFPKTETAAETDQRGKERLSMTCAGAYELEDDTPLNIYVKKTGTGDGSNWENAMSEKDFYTLLPKAKNGTTFHIAAGTYQKGSKLSAYKINSDVNLIGGYPADAEDGAVSDPVNNHTTFDTEKGPYGYTAITTELFSLSEGVSVEFHNLDFSHSTITAGANIHKLLADSCRFMNGCADIKLTGGDSLVIRNSYFHKMIEGLRLGSGVYHVRFSGGYALVDNSTFVGSTADRGLKAISLSGLKKNSHVQNCTFINLMGPNTGYQIEFHATEGDGPIYFINNTIVGNGENEGINTDQQILSFLNGVAFIGNIYAGTDNVNVKEPNTIANAYNLVGFESASKTNKTITIDDLASILAGTYTDGVFSPTLSLKNGGFTPTVELISDKLPDGAPIRFPLEETSVTTDQRGVTRLDNTCAGAYEIEDDAPPMEVYVKKTGTGHGTSWDDAMGEADFFSAMPKAKEGTTFYVAAGEYTKTISSPVEMKNGIKVIGGYPADAKKGAVSDPVNNHTVLKPGNGSKIMFTYFFNYGYGEGKQTVEFHNLDFLNTGLELKVDNIVVDSCNFYECNNPVNISFAQNLRISNSYFSKNQSKNDLSDYSIFIGSDPVAVIENCAFDEQPYTTAIKVDSYYDTASVQIVNNTFLLRDRANTEWADEEGEHYYFYLGSKKVASLLHNTIAIVDASGYLNVSESMNKIGVKRADLYYNLFTIGDPKIITFVGGGDAGSSLYSNLFGKDNSIGNQNYNIPDELKNVLDGTNSSAGFIPTLAYNGGYTPTIKLVKDKLSDGVTVRTSQNIKYRIATDQRGVERKISNTCPGAYEIECSADSVSATDTIRIGEEIAGRTFASIGVYDSIFEKLENRLGCDSVVMHKVIVTPNPDKTEYYVKKTGKGDGSSWDDAMGEKEFDLVLKTLATDNVTFYVAEGTYHAAYDKNLNEVKRAGSWTTSHPISIIGGFPASSTGKVKSTDVPDVKEYPTILSGDYKDNTEAQGHECYFDFQNSSDDFQGDLFTIDMSETGGESKISNIILTGVRNQHGAPSTIVIKGSKTKESSFTFYQSEVRRSEQAIKTEDVTNLTVDECEFNHVLGGINTTASSKITKSTFNYCGVNIHDAEECEVSNCTFAHTSLDVVCGAQTNRLYNNTFVSCGSTNIYLDRTNYIRGNIFASSSIYSSGENTGKTVIEDNVIACAYGDLSLEDKNIITNRAILSDGILDMEYSAEDDKISPNLTNKGGRTSVVALLKEVLPTGEKLRFDRLDGIATDQRGVERNAKTCPGAYEIDCSDFKVTFSPKDVLCNELGGTLTLAATGGTGNYTALVKTADGDTLAYKSFSKDKELTVNGLKLATTYTAVVEDAQGCHAEDKGIRVQRKDLLEVKAEARAYMQTCHGEDNGEILIKYSGNDEEENLLFSAVGEDGKAHSVAFSSAEGRAVIDSLAPGDYSVFMDFNVEDCDLPSPAAMQVGNVTVDSIGEMGIDSLTLKVTYATCTNPANGRADIDILNWLNGYTITVYSNGNPIWGTMEASPNGEYEGAAPCQFYFENAEKKAERTAHLKIPRINGGKFTIEVKDECENVCKPFTFEVGKLYMPFVQLREDNSHIELDCAGMSNGSIYFSVNGYAPKSKAYVNDEEVFVGHGTCMKDNLPAGKYVIAYRSIEEGCKDEAVDTIVITEPLPLEIHNSAAPVVCEDLGTIAYSGVAGGTPDYTYRWTDAAGNLLGTDDSLKNLSVGKDYKLVVTDSKSCKDSVTFDVELLNTSGLNNIVIEKVDHKDQYCYNEDNGKISIQFSGNAFKDPLKVVAINDTGIVKSVVTSDESGLIELKELPADTYDVKLSYDFGDCDVSVGAISVAENLIIQPLEKPEFIEDNYFKVDNKCENGGKGRMHLEMKGWKEDVYSWTIERAAQPSDTVYKHCGDKLSNGATAFDLWTLPEGVNIFTMWDACTFKYTKTETIKADYTSPLTLDTFDCKAYTCADRTDGSFTFTAWPWDVEDSVTILKDDKKWKEDLKPTEIKEGKAYFKFENQGAGTYKLSATDLCKRAADTVFNFTKFSEQNGLLTVEAGFDDNPEECELGKRIIKATANGGTAPYVYSISRDGKAVETSEAIDTTVYDSKLLGEGKYSVSVTDNTDCKVVYGEDLTIKSESLNIKLGTLKKIDQYCYGVDNAGVSVAYSGFDKDVAKLRLSAKDKSKKDTIYESFAEDEKDTLKITGLPVGSYDVKVQLLGFNGCELNGGILLETEVEFQPLEMPEFIEDNYFKVDNKCENGGKGRMHLEMKGWKEDVYSWTIERAAQPSDTVYKHCGDKLANGATAFDLWTLPEGVNIFTMWDACTFKYTKTETIKADYTAPLTLDTFDCKAYTCADRTDGSFTFTAWPWDVEDSVTILKDGKTWKEDLKPTEIKEGKAYFKFKNQGAGTYTLSATDLCKRAADSVFNFTKFSEKNGLLTVDVDFDAESAKCDANKRIFKIKATGGTAPYVYNITKDGEEFLTTEATESGLYTTQLLPVGNYKVSVSDETECKAEHGDDLTLNSTHTLKADMREVVCGDSKNVIITTSVDGGETTAIGFTAVDEEGKQYDASAIVDDKGTVLFTLPADTVLKGLIAETEDQCRTYAEVGTLSLDENALAKAKVEIDTVINERCYHANNGEVRLSYTGQESPYGIAMRLINVNDITDTINTESQYGKELKFKVDTLAPGEYEIYMVQKVGSCDAGTEPKKIQNIKIDSIPHPFELVWDTVIQSKCASDMNGRLALRVHGWSRYNCTWELSKSNGTEFIPFASDTTAFPVSGDTATWGSDNRDAGLYRITWTDYCGNSVSKQVQIDTIKKPTIELLASSHTDLMCGYEKAYIDFKYESPSAENKRILIKYKPTPDSEDWDYTTEPLKPSNTYRLYGFNPGSGNRGHKKAEGTDYELTDADKGLPGGQYLIFYMDPTEKCADDDTFISVNVYKPEVKLNLAKQDVLCYSENNGVINIVPTRSGKNPIYYDYMDQYPDCTDYSEIRDKGRNFGSIVFKDSASQVKAFADRDKFLSDVFSDVAYLSITAKKMSQKDLYKLMQDSIKAHGSNLKYPLSKFYRGGGSDYAVSDWIGFNTMPVDMYYVTLTDTFGCVYTDSIEIKGPEDGLRVISAVYPNGSDPECNAESRRIKFTCTGGYYPYFYSVVNTDEEQGDENDTKGSGMIGQDYVTGAIVEKYKENDKIRIDYTSKMLKAGTYEVSVMDTMGCVAKWKEKIEVKAKHELNGIPHVDVCDPSSANKVELFGADKSASYTLYVGHRTRCKYYPYCSVDDENGGLHIIDGKKRHIHEYVSENGEPEYENCVEHRAGIKAGDIEYKVKENNRWVSKSGYGISDIPSGTIGVLATMPDGCTAFDEYTFQSSGLPTSIMPVAMDSVSCNGVEDGAVSFSLYGGHGSYTEIALDGENLEIKHPKIEMITVSQKDTHAPYETSSKTINVKGGLLNNGQLFDQLKKYYDGEALYAEAVQLLKNSGSDTTYDMVSAIVSDLREFYGLTTYSFKIDDLSATVNWEDNDSHRNKKHVITVTDEQDCKTSMEFDIYQPTKLKLSVGASVICPDGSGRIFAANTSGGVPPYLYRLDKTTIDDVNAVFPKSGSKPKTYEGIELGNADAYGQYYAREYHKGDHIPAGKGVEHFMYVMDDNGCIMKSSNHTKLSDSWSWDSIEQDQLISTWHNYGDVLVVIDQTDYDSLTDEKGMIVNAVYDSMKVIIVMDKDAEDFEGIIQPKEMFAYGVRECSFAMEGEGEDIIEKCDTVVTPFDTCCSPSWGITPKMLEKYNEYIAEGHSLKPIHEYYQQLIPDSALLRMTFVKFRTKSGRDVNLSELIGNKDDYHLNFMIRVVAYVGGCDVVTEHNPLVLNLQGDDPFPGVNYKDLITVDAFPNPVARDGKCTLNVTLSNDRNEFSYTVFSLTGEVLGKGTIWQNHPHKEEKDEYGNSEYIYEFDITNIKETCIVKVTTETNTAAVKILAR